MIEWLEPSLEKRINEIIDAFIICSDTNESQKKILTIISEINEGYNLGAKFLELEDLFHLNLALSIEHSYRVGFRDAINLKGI